MQYSLLAAPLIFTVFTVIAKAGLVSSNSISQVNSTVITTSDAADSSTDPVPLQAIATEINSFTDSRIDYLLNVGTNTMSFSGSIVEEKTVAAKPGGVHVGLVDWTFTFTTDSDMEFALNGTWGFDNGNTGSDDFISYALTGPGTSVTNSITTGASTAFSEGAVISAGTYSLVFDMEQYETVNNQGTRGGVFSGTFSLTAVPEPALLSLMVCVLTMCCGRRRRRVAR